MAVENMVQRINVGCGQTPTPGWSNFDNSLSVRLAKHRRVTTVLDKLGLLEKAHKDFIAFATNADIKFANGAKSIPLANNSVGVMYSCHMLEHLDKQDARAFLIEAQRVLVSGGILRLALPDISKQVKEYIETGDADAFIDKTKLTRTRPRTVAQRLKYLLLGDRDHLWMYDGPSLVRFMRDAGFQDVRIMPPGETMIADPGQLDLREREDDSVYVEAVNL
jgi:ubiquinone/menaquinone biosynthesis C-methylase UbiE